MSFDLSYDQPSLDEIAQTEADLAPITEELSATERAEFELNLHLVQPTPYNKFVVFTNFCSE